MKRTTYILSAAFLSLTIGSAAIACEYHSGYGSPFQSRWGNYVPADTPADEQSLYENEEASEVSVQPVIKKKPVFSKAASRASDVAKARVERKAKSEADAKAADTKITQQASR